MEQARCWMWTKRKHTLSSHLQVSNRSSSAYDDSWEEQAFAEDAAGPLGGCIWPPRSYSCSFCRREFRSAQALGGHMNVHRRDRARLKQSPPLAHHHNELVPQHHHDRQNHNNLFQTTYSPSGFQFPSHKICTFVYSPNPNSDPPVISSPSSPSKASITPPTQPNCDEKNFFSSLSSPPTRKDKKESPRSSPSSWPSSTVTDRHYNVSDPTSEGEKKSRILESGSRAKADYFKKDLPVTLNLVVQRVSSDGEDEENIRCKRRKITASSSPFFIESDSIERQDDQSEVFEIGPCSVEELDLELRL